MSQLSKHRMANDSPILPFKRYSHFYKDSLWGTFNIIWCTCMTSFPSSVRCRRKIFSWIWQFYKGNSSNCLTPSSVFLTLPYPSFPYTSLLFSLSIHWIYGGGWGNFLSFYKSSYYWLICSLLYSVKCLFPSDMSSSKIGEQVKKFHSTYLKQ